MRIYNIRKYLQTSASLPKERMFVSFTTIHYWKRLDVGTILLKTLALKFMFSWCVPSKSTFV
jgi:hypothetical protein